MHMDVLVPRSTGMCESGLARECGIPWCRGRYISALLSAAAAVPPGMRLAVFVQVLASGRGSVASTPA
jgi:hypothetical protein